jgi:hypothetical protein
MTPEQLRLLCPLRPQTPVETLCNVANLAWTVWPFSAVHAAAIGYCEAFLAVIDPLPRDFCQCPGRP